MPSAPPKTVIFAITATGIMGNALINPSLPEIAEGLGAAESAIGLILGATTLPGIVMAPVLGALADTWGRRRVLVPSLVLFGVAGVLGMLAPNLPVLLASRLLLGVGSAGLINLAIVLIGDHYPERRSTVIGQNSAVLTTCLALYPPIGGLLTDTFGFRAPFALYAIAGLTAVLVARTVPDGVEDADGPTGVVAQVGAALPALRRRPVPGLFGTGFVAFALVFGLLLTVVPLLLSQQFGLSPTERGIFLAGISVCNGLTAINLGRISSVLDQRARIAGGLLLFAAGATVIALAPTLWLMAPAVVLVGVGDGLLIPSLQNGVAGAAEDRNRGTVVAVFVSFARMGQTIGPVAASSAIAAVGSAAVMGGGGVIALVAAPVVFWALREAGASADDGTSEETAAQGPSQSPQLPSDGDPPGDRPARMAGVGDE